MTGPHGGPEGWNDTPLQYRDVFQDGLVLNYFDENTGPDTLLFVTH